MTVQAERDRLVDLAVANATEGLNDGDLALMRRLRATHPDLDPTSFERTAAVIDLAFQEDAVSDEPLPEHLSRRLLAQAGVRSATRQRPDAADRTSSTMSWLARGLAAAAAVVAILLITTDAEAPPPTATERMEALLDTRGSVTAGWVPAEEGTFPGTSGDVVWNDGTQEGYMRFRGLPANDPLKAQYQLWIVDPSRDAKPVDGGVFDVADGAAEVVIPIRAKLLVNAPKAFVITSEQPGGVVVSDGPFLLIAQP